MSIDPKLTCGAVALIVADLDRSLRYYEHNIGLRVRQQEGRTAWLGVDGRDLLQLSELRGARSVQRGHTGLYHFAILTPNRFELSRTLRHLAATDTRIDGASDHGVSEALYLTDPDGHGIEIYRDRPQRRVAQAGRSAEHDRGPAGRTGAVGRDCGADQAWDGLHCDTVIGHVHLHVADLREAEQFYVAPWAWISCSASATRRSLWRQAATITIWASMSGQGVGAPPPPGDARGWTGSNCGYSSPTDAGCNRAAAGGRPGPRRGGRGAVVGL